MNPDTQTFITVIGDGGWGTTLAIHLAKKGYPVSLWGPFPEYVNKMAKNRYNSKFLPGIRIPEKVKLICSLKDVISAADLIVFAIPSKFATSIIKKIKRTNINLEEKMFLNVTKGFDYDSLLPMTEVITQILGDIPLAVLSGPTIATEVAKGIPSSAVVGTENKKLAVQIQEIFSTDRFRIYRNTDMLGVELGGALKNIIAIACGVCDGLGYGTNTKSALLTRGLAEMARLGKALGAKTQTFSGLSGMGDLATTCFSPQSRNRSVGEKLGKGKSIKDITAKMNMVAEGVESVRAVRKLSQKLKIETPISQEVYNIIYHQKKPQQAVDDLMLRPVTTE